MMRKFQYIVSLTAMLACLLTGCNQSDSTEEKAMYTLEVTSTVSAEDCYICGNGYGTLMPYYGETDSIGIIYWNDPMIIDTKVRVYAPDGTECFHTGAMMMGGIISGGKHGSAVVHAFPDQGRSEISIRYQENDEIDFKAVKKILCQDCLDRVVNLYVEYKNHGEESTIGTTGFSLVDFQTKEIYSLSGPTVGYGIRDYFVRFFTDKTLDGVNNITKNGTVEVLILYIKT